MSEWKVSTLQDLVVLLKDGTHGTHKDFFDGIPMLSAKDILNGKILIPDNARTISEHDYKAIHSTYEIERDDLLLTIVGTIGRCAIVKEKTKKFTLQRSVGIIRLNKNIVSPEYIYNYFQSKKFQLELEKSINASAQGGIYLGKLGKIEISYPVLIQEQLEIANRLSTINIVIEKTQSAIAKYKAIKQGMLHDLFTRGIDMQTGQLRHKYEDAPELYKESELGMVPTKWNVDVLELLSDKIGSGVTPTGGSEVYKASGILFIRSQNVLKGSLSLNDVAFISSEIDEIMQGSRVKPFDVLLNITGASIGRCAYFPKELEFANVNQHVCIIRFKNASKEIAIVASEFLNSNFGQNQINRSNAGGNREGLNFKQIGNFYFPEIESEELVKISNKIEMINSQLKSEQSYLQKLQQIKTGLMNDLLTGKINVNLAE
jgi:type I restriction enzyme S subunit